MKSYFLKLSLYFSFIFFLSGNLPLVGQNLDPFEKGMREFIADQEILQQFKNYGIAEPISIGDIRNKLVTKRDQLFNHVVTNLHQKCTSLSQEEYGAFEQASSGWQIASRLILVYFPELFTVVKEYDESTLRDPEIPLWIVQRIESLVR